MAGAGRRHRFLSGAWQPPACAKTSWTSTGLVHLRGISKTATHHRHRRAHHLEPTSRPPLPPAFDALKAGGAGSRLGADPECRHRRRQPLQRLAGGRRRAALLILDAEVELRSVHGSRHLPLPEFILGNRRRRCGPARWSPPSACRRPPPAGSSAFFKLGARRYLVISIAMAAARLVPCKDGDRRGCAVAVGACSAVAQRLPALEAALRGRRLKPRARQPRRGRPSRAAFADRRRARQRRLPAARRAGNRCARSIAAAAGG